MNPQGRREEEKGGGRKRGKKLSFSHCTSLYQLSCLVIISCILFLSIMALVDENSLPSTTLRQKRCVPNPIPTREAQERGLLSWSICLKAKQLDADTVINCCFWFPQAQRWWRPQNLISFKDFQGELLLLKACMDSGRQGVCNTP